MKRINVIKVLANKSWGLNIKTLNQVYNSLIRSLLEYSSIIYPCFSATNIPLLERIPIISSIATYNYNLAIYFDEIIKLFVNEAEKVFKNH